MTNAECKMGKAKGKRKDKGLRAAGWGLRAGTVRLKVRREGKGSGRKGN